MSDTASVAPHPLRLATYRHYLLARIASTIALAGLTLIIGWPLVVGWIHGAAVLGNLHGLFLLLVALASALGGAGKWAVGRG